MSESILRMFILTFLHVQNVRFFLGCFFFTLPLQIVFKFQAYLFEGSWLQHFTETFSLLLENICLIPVILNSMTVNHKLICLKFVTYTIFYILIHSKDSNPKDKKCEKSLYHSCILATKFPSLEMNSVVSFLCLYTKILYANLYTPSLHFKNISGGILYVLFYIFVVVNTY